MHRECPKEKQIWITDSFFQLTSKKSIFMAKIPPSNKFSQAKQKKLCNLNLKRRILPQFPSFPERREKETKNCFYFHVH
ncbi:hypothetical protein V6Z11_A03G250400 [Gossypium hirsutum]